MFKLGRQHKDRIWTVEGCNGIDKQLAQRLVADSEIVVDVPAKLSARARAFDTGQDARPIRPTHTTSRSLRCAVRACGRST